MLHIHVPLFHLLSCNLLLHPQVKLEHSCIVPIIPWSIPAGRGKVALCIVDVRAIGITPAWAGKSRNRQQGKRLSEDHPRMGGEKKTSPHITASCQGSPPHGRGKGVSGLPPRGHPGITPAWAGKSGGPLYPASFARDHPRMGGEKRLLLGIGCKGLGSPPHGRGKVLVTRSFVSRTGITPAWAGKSHLAIFLSRVNKDHPRMGGEKAAGYG